MSKEVVNSIRPREGKEIEVGEMRKDSVKSQIGACPQSHKPELYQALKNPQPELTGGVDPECLSAQDILAVWRGRPGLLVGRLLAVLDSGIDPSAPCGGI